MKKSNETGDEYAKPINRVSNHVIDEFGHCATNEKVVDFG